MEKKKEKEFDYGHGITQSDVDRYNNRPKLLKDKRYRPEGQSIADWLTEKPFLYGCSEYEKAEFIKLVRQAAGWDDESNNT